MTEAQPVPISINEAITQLTFLPDRTPAGVDDDAADAFKRLSAYRDGAVFFGHWAGHSEWERHNAGDEIASVVDGTTTIVFLDGETEHAATLHAGELVVVPSGTWRRFETPEVATLLSVAPQPTDHTSDRPT